MSNKTKKVSSTRKEERIPASRSENSPRPPLISKSGKKTRRRRSSTNPNPQRVFWTEKDDALLIKLVSEHGVGNWTLISTFIPGRNNKQCRDRYRNHLDPLHISQRGTNTAWSLEEDECIVRFVNEFGTLWAQFSQIPGIITSGRSEHELKNRWHSSLKAKVMDGKFANVSGWVGPPIPEKKEGKLVKTRFGRKVKGTFKGETAHSSPFSEVKEDDAYEDDDNGCQDYSHRGRIDMALDTELTQMTRIKGRSGTENNNDKLYPELAHAIAKKRTDTGTDFSEPNFEEMSTPAYIPGGSDSFDFPTPILINPLLPQSTVMQTSSHDILKPLEHIIPGSNGLHRVPFQRLQALHQQTPMNPSALRDAILRLAMLTPYPTHSENGLPALPMPGFTPAQWDVLQSLQEQFRLDGVAECVQADDTPLSQAIISNLDFLSQTTFPSIEPARALERVMEAGECLVAKASKLIGNQ